MWASLLGGFVLAVLAGVAAWRIVFRYVVPTSLSYGVTFASSLWALVNAVAFFANFRSLGGFDMAMLFVVGLSVSGAMALCAIAALGCREANIEYHRVSSLSSF